MHEEQRLGTVISLIESYHFQKPLALFLREHFRSHRNMGSRDRRIVTQSIYSFFRLGKLLASLPLSERIALGLFLCSKEDNELNALCIQNNSSLHHEDVLLPLKQKTEKFQAIYPAFTLRDLYCFQDYMSP